MFSFLIRRICHAGMVMLVVTLLAFVLFQYVGDPVTGLLGQDATPEQRQALRTQLGLNDSVGTQFARFILRSLSGDLGMSLQHGRKVSGLIVERLPATAELSVCAMLLSLVGGIPIGVWCALKVKKIFTHGLMMVTLLGVSLPSFLIGILLIYLFSVTWHVLPSFGRGEVVAVGWWTTGFLTGDGWRHLVLPAMTLAFFQLALISRLVRSEMIEVLRAEYIKFAKARGLSSWAIHFRHALRNTLVPVSSIIGLQFGSLLAFSIITESVFQWPGLGLLLIQAIHFSDIPVMAAYLCLVALIFVVLHLLTDLLYFWIDPRLRSHLLKASDESRPPLMRSQPQ